MNKIITLAVALLLLAGCKKEENGNNNVNPCGTPSLSINLVTGGVDLYVNGNTSAGFYEIEYGSNGFSRGSGTKATINTQYSLSGLTNGTYDIYVRANCGGTSYSDWSSAQSFLVTGGNSSTCPAPYNLGVNPYNQGYQLRWSVPNSPGYYELEYGLTGFSRGSGTKKTVSTNSYTQGTFNANNTYDFYVRSNCGGSDFSPWAGPYSFYADHNAHTCQPPTNLAAYRNGGYIHYTYSLNGENQQEVYINNTANTTSGTLLTSSGGSGDITNIYSNVTYYIYLRSICLDGSRTAWAGPVVVN